MDISEVWRAYRALEAELEEAKREIERLRAELQAKAPLVNP